MRARGLEDFLGNRHLLQAQCLRRTAFSTGCQAIGRVSDSSSQIAIRCLIDSLEAGGAERVCLHLCNGWTGHGLSVELLLVRAAGPYLKELDGRVSMRDFRAARARKALWPAIRYLRGSSDAPLLIFGFHLAVGILAAKKLGLVPGPVIYREASSPRANINRSMHWAYRFLVGRANRVIAQNRQAHDELASLGVPSNRITIIPNPCPSLTLPPIANAQPTPRDGTLFLSVGRLAPEKGFDRLIRAFPVYLRSHPNARLAILGEGTERARLASLIQDLGLRESVNLVGFVQDLVPWYEKTGLFVLPSRYEGQPNVLMEAIAHCCPVLCAAGKGGIIEVMDACGLADCVVPEDSFEQSFAERVRYVLAKDSAAWRNARARLAELAHPDKVLARYLDACGVPAAASFGATVRSQPGAAATERG